MALSINDRVPTLSELCDVDMRVKTVSSLLRGAEYLLLMFTSFSFEQTQV